MMVACISALVLVLPTAAGWGPSPPLQAADSAELVRLEAVWNVAHVHGDTLTLSSLWGDEMTVIVPEMPVMSKIDLLQFWRTGRSVITKYETTEIRVRVYGDAAVVTGRLRRDRNFNGRSIGDDWRFTKVYVRRGGRWQVVAYQASVSAG